MTSHLQFWKEREIPAGRSCLWRLGHLRMWIQRLDDAWRLASEYGESMEPMSSALVPNDVVPSVMEWQRLALVNPARSFRFTPEMPDRALVARPEERVTIPSGERVTYYCLLPTWVRFELKLATRDEWQPFDSRPTRRLADTWFGDHSSGLLGYALAVPAGRDWQRLPIGPHHVIVPVRITNSSAEHLDFERLCIRPQFLGVHASRHELWSNAIDVVFHGAARESTIRYDPRPPSEAVGSRSIATPREKAERSLVGITFSHPSPSDFRSRL